MLALGLAFSVISAAIIVFRYRKTAHEGTFGATTVVAAMLAFTLGAFAVLGDVQAAAAAGVAVAGLLSLKRVLHDWLKRLSWNELRSDASLRIIVHLPKHRSAGSAPLWPTTSRNAPQCNSANSTNSFVSVDAI